jgi:GNAT superfamily N-acetyltransferase
MIYPFEQEFNSGTKKRPNAYRGRIYRCVILVIDQKDEHWARLLLIETPRYRRRGLGRTALQWLCDLADKHQVTLELTVCSYAKSNVGMQDEHLIHWYQKFEFRRIGLGSDMLRYPSLVTTKGYHDATN